ncbi:hypothetical protein P171DRAFT_53728 [Karstenula rhodostoma CBS 690.94]|uniref:Transmembrane protein n=1 Tax=Karstenula rhodostoma CBS 690.94 TaxID=1392251 RepID=A0A9P4UBC7_9PLEO|nr:hypothetical protein P171DRAFT_53728 [Karstenula rhodostoma CBS 690.94]
MTILSNSSNICPTRSLHLELPPSHYPRHQALRPRIMLSPRPTYTEASTSASASTSPSSQPSTPTSTDLEAQHPGLTPPHIPTSYNCTHIIVSILLSAVAVCLFWLFSTTLKTIPEIAVLVFLLVLVLFYVS